MNIVDGIIIALLIVGGFNGFRRGLLSSILGILSLVGALTVAYFLGQQAQGLLELFQVNTMIEQFLNTSVFINNSLFETNLSDSNVIQMIQDGLTAIGMPSFITDALNTFINDLNQPLGEALAEGLTNLAMLVLSFVLVYFIARLVITLVLKSLVKIVKDNKISSSVDKILGLLFGLLRTTVFIMVLISALMAISFINQDVNTFLVDQFQLNSANFSIGKQFYQWISEILALIV
jgi:uncharacterized membrane protein required for colicin V production